LRIVIHSGDGSWNDTGGCSLRLTRNGAGMTRERAGSGVLEVELVGVKGDTGGEAAQ